MLLYISSEFTYVLLTHTYQCDIEYKRDTAPEIFYYFIPINLAMSAVATIAATVSNAHLVQEQLTERMQYIQRVEYHAVDGSIVFTHDMECLKRVDLLTQQLDTLQHVTMEYVQENLHYCKSKSGNCSCKNTKLQITRFVAVLHAFVEDMWQMLATDNARCFSNAMTWIQRLQQTQKYVHFCGNRLYHRHRHILRFGKFCTYRTTLADTFCVTTLDAFLRPLLDVFEYNVLQTTKTAHMPDCKPYCSKNHTDLIRTCVVNPFMEFFDDLERIFVTTLRSAHELSLM